MEEKKVLIVDDEENICIALSDLLKRTGFKVFTSLSAEDAMQIFQNENPKFCIIDIHMPFSKFDGIELLRRIKNINKDTSCVMLTRIEDEEKIKEAKLLGIEDYIIKPVGVERIKALIEYLKEK